MTPYLDRDHTRGGHVLDFMVTLARVEISMRSDLHLCLPTAPQFPTTPQFLHGDLDRGDVDADVSRVEGD
jgi:acetolactate decarboxylase